MYVGINAGDKNTQEIKVWGNLVRTIIIINNDSDDEGEGTDKEVKMAFFLISFDDCIKAIHVIDPMGFVTKDYHVYLYLGFFPNPTIFIRNLFFMN